MANLWTKHFVDRLGERFPHVIFPDLCKSASELANDVAAGVYPLLKKSNKGNNIFLVDYGGVTMRVVTKVEPPDFWLITCIDPFAPEVKPVKPKPTSVKTNKCLKNKVLRALALGLSRLRDIHLHSQKHLEGCDKCKEYIAQKKLKHEKEETW